MNQINQVSRIRTNRKIMEALEQAIKQMESFGQCYPSFVVLVLLVCIVKSVK